MSEEVPPYGQSEARPEIYRRFGDGWLPPTPAELQSELRKAGLSAPHAARLVGLYSLDPVLEGPQSMHYSAWRLLCIYSGSVAADRRTN